MSFVLWLILLIDSPHQRIARSFCTLATLPWGDGFIQLSSLILMKTCLLDFWFAILWCFSIESQNRMASELQHIKHNRTVQPFALRAKLTLMTEKCICQWHQCQIVSLLLFNQPTPRRRRHSCQTTLLVGTRLGRRKASPQSDSGPDWCCVQL